MQRATCKCNPIAATIAQIRGASESACTRVCQTNRGWRTSEACVFRASVSCLHLWWARQGNDEMCARAKSRGAHARYKGLTCQRNHSTLDGTQRDVGIQYLASIAARRACVEGGVVKNEAWRPMQLPCTAGYTQQSKRHRIEKENRRRNQRKYNATDLPCRRSQTTPGYRRK